VFVSVDLVSVVEPSSVIVTVVGSLMVTVSVLVTQMYFVRVRVTVRVTVFVTVLVFQTVTVRGLVVVVRPKWCATGVVAVAVWEWHPEVFGVVVVDETGAPPISVRATIRTPAERTAPEASEWRTIRRRERG
jgi:hypothetical protein